MHACAATASTTSPSDSPLALRQSRWRWKNSTWSRYPGSTGFIDVNGTSRRGAIDSVARTYAALNCSSLDPSYERTALWNSSTIPPDFARNASVPHFRSALLNLSGTFTQKSSYRVIREPPSDAELPSVDGVEKRPDSDRGPRGPQEHEAEGDPHGVPLSCEEPGQEVHAQSPDRRG